MKKRMSKERAAVIFMAGFLIVMALMSLGAQRLISFMDSRIRVSYSEAGNFTNQYGTPSTTCAYPGCTHKIASSGDTNCCTVHSNKCLNCGKYIDSDAMYCMKCIYNAALN